MKRPIVVPPSSAPSGSRFDERREDDVRVEGESDHAVLRGYDAVDGWLDDAGVAAAEMRHGRALVPDHPLGAGRNMELNDQEKEQNICHVRARNAGRWLER